MSLTRKRLEAMRASVEARRDLRHSPGLSCSDVLALIDAALRLDVLVAIADEAPHVSSAPLRILSKSDE